MIGRLILYEKRKISKKIPIFIFLFIILAVFVILKLNTGDYSSYKDEIYKWEENVVEFDKQTEELSNCQKDTYASGKYIINLKSKVIGKNSDEINSNMYKSAVGAESVLDAYEWFILVVSCILAFVVIGNEQKSKEIYQSMLLPVGRAGLFGAKNILALLIMLAISLTTYVVMMISLMLMYGSEFFDYSAYGQTIPFAIYCLLRIVISLIPGIALYLFVNVMLLYLERNIVSIVIVGICLLVLYVIGSLGTRMFYSWSNFVPTKSFNLKTFFLNSGCVVDEIGFIQEKMSNVVDIKVSRFIILFYDFTLMVGLFLAGCEKFENKDF